MTWQAVVMHLIDAIAPTLVALAGLIVALRNRDKLEEVHETVNGRMEQLIQQNRREASIRAVTEERARVDRGEDF